MCLSHDIKLIMPKTLILKCSLKNRKAQFKVIKLRPYHKKKTKILKHIFNINKHSEKFKIKWNGLYLLKMVSLHMWMKIKPEPFHLGEVMHQTLKDKISKMNIQHLTFGFSSPIKISTWRWRKRPKSKKK